jgi:hypothetical protein
MVEGRVFEGLRRGEVEEEETRSVNNALALVTNENFRETPTSFMGNFGKLIII